MASNISEKIASTQIVYSRHNLAHFIVENQTKWHFLTVKKLEHKQTAVYLYTN